MISLAEVILAYALYTLMLYILVMQYWIWIHVKQLGHRPIMQ